MFSFLLFFTRLQFVILPQVSLLGRDFSHDFGGSTLFSYTTIPLKTTACVLHNDTCQAMQTISDSLDSTCQLSVDCLVLNCSTSSNFTTTLTLSPCDYSVKLRLFQAGVIDFERIFVQSDIETLYSNDINTLMIDVTVARFRYRSVLGFQVCIM